MIADLILSPKFAPLFAGATSGAFTSIAVTLSDIAHGNGLVATVMVASASILGALFAKLPDIIRARTDSHKTEVEVHEGETEKLIANIYKAHDRETAALEAIVRRSDLRNERLEAVHAVLRASKHEALQEVQRLVMVIAELHEAIRECGGEVPPYTPPDFAELMAEEDLVLKRLANVPEVKPLP